MHEGKQRRCVPLKLVGGPARVSVFKGQRFPLTPAQTFPAAARGTHSCTQPERSRPLTLRHRAGDGGQHEEEEGRAVQLLGSGRPLQPPRCPAQTGGVAQLARVRGAKFELLSGSSSGSVDVLSFPESGNRSKLRQARRQHGQENSGTETFNLGTLIYQN